MSIVYRRKDGSTFESNLFPPPRRQWGPWKFQVGGLKNIPADYLIGWDRIQTTGDVFEWILHMKGKGISDFYGGAEMLYGLVAAFDEVLCISKYRGKVSRGECVPLETKRLVSEYRQSLRDSGVWL